jgi:light-regulated signal transduction histidine kinase (bacteriophytochrome)
MEKQSMGFWTHSRVGGPKLKQINRCQRNDRWVTETLILKWFWNFYKWNFHVIGHHLLNQVFSNLIGNAIKYNDKPIGKVVCFYESIPGFHQFSIKDNGPGLRRSM